MLALSKLKRLEYPNVDEGMIRIEQLGLYGELRLECDKRGIESLWRRSGVAETCSQRYAATPYTELELS